MEHDLLKHNNSKISAKAEENVWPQYIAKGFLLLLTIIAFAIFFSSPLKTAAAFGAPDDFVDLSEKLAPSVVNISSTQAVPDEDETRAMPELAPGSPFQEFFDQFENRREQQPERPKVSMGSGFFISSDGYVVTNNHVISDASEVSVRTSDGEEYDAEIIGRDTDLDIALLKITSDDEFTPLDFADSDDIRVGEWVIAIGNPFGLGGSVTAGIISARHRRISAGPYDDFIQTDASINRGNSGGPLLDMDGDVIGVNTMIFTPNGGNIGIGFSIPSNDVKRTIAHLQEFGKPIRGWIGVSIQVADGDMAEGLGYEGTEGTVVSEIVPGGPAEAAGVELYDIILSFNGEHVKSRDDLPRIVANTNVNQEVEVEVWRAGEIITLTLTTGEKDADKENDEAEEEAEPEDVQTHNQILGMRIAPLSEALREQYNIPSDVNGLLVANLSRSSDAAQSGMRPGDIIVQVYQRDVSELAELKDAIERATDAGRKAILLRIYRGGNYFLIPLKLPQEKDEE